MLNVASGIGWTRAGPVLALLMIGGFLVSWLTTDVFNVARRRYIAVLAALTAVLTIATVWLTHAPTADFFGHHWGWGLAGAAITGIIVGCGIRKTPASLPRTGHELHEAEA